MRISAWELFGEHCSLNSFTEPDMTKFLNSLHRHTLSKENQKFQKASDAGVPSAVKFANNRFIACEHSLQQADCSSLLLKGSDVSYFVGKKTT